MFGSRIQTLFVVALSAACFSLGHADAFEVPKADQKHAARENAVKELVGKIVTAIGQQDIDALVDMSDFPWCRGLTIVAKDKKELRRHMKAGFDEKPIFEAKYRIKQFETFAAAKARLEDVEIKGLQQVLAAEDYVIHVEIDYPDRKLQVRVYVKMNAGKPRFVGHGKED